MARDADWYTTGTVPETPPSSTRATLSRETSKTSPAPDHAQNSQTSPPSPESKFHITPHNRQETTNKVIKYAGEAAADHLRSSFRDASKLNPYLSEIGKLEKYPEQNGYDWEAAKREARARGWKTSEEGNASTPWMRRDALRRSYEGLGKINGGRTGGDMQAVKYSAEPVVELNGVQRAPMPNGKLRKIERTKPVQAPSLPREDTYTMDLTGDSD